MKRQQFYSLSLISMAVYVAFSHQVMAEPLSDNNGEIEQIEVVQHRQPYRGDVPLKSLPQSVDIVSAELLNNLGIVELQNALDFTSGVARQNSFGGLWDSFAIRGFAGDENSPSGYLVNGYNVGRGFSGRRDTSNIQSIEILKGPGSALYGRGEPGGTINIITKKPEFSPEGYIKATPGTEHLKRLEAAYTNAINSDVAFRINGAYEDAGSFRDTVTSKKWALTPSILFRLSEQTKFSYELEVIDQQAPFDRGIVVIDNQFGQVPSNTFYGEPADGPMKIDVTGHQFSLQHEFTNGWNLITGLNYRDSSFTGYSSEVEPSTGRQLLFEDLDGDGNADGEIVSRQRRYRDYQATDFSGRMELSGKLTTAKVTHHLLMGLDAYKYQLDQSMQRWRTAWGAQDPSYSVDLLNPVYGQPQPAVSLVTDQQEEQKSFGAYVQDQIDLTDNWKLLAGLRFDKYQKDLHNVISDSHSHQSQTALNPRLGLVYDISKNYTIYTSYSEGFRPNSGADVNNKTFEPEESKSYETGIKFNNDDQSLSGTVALFRANKINVLGADPVNSGFSIALGEAQSQGIEIDLDAYISANTSVSLAYSYIDAQTENEIVNGDWNVVIPAGSQLINIPRNKLNVTTVHEFSLAGDLAKVGASLTYVGERLGETINPDYILPSYTKVDIFAVVDLSNNWRLSAYINNLLDKEYYSNSYSSLWTQPGAPRSAKIGVQYSF